MPASMQINSDPGVSNFINTGDTNLVRAMPTVGVEYRYPFISVQSWGTQTFEPIAQVIVRPNETQIGKMPNEDAQSLIFDDSNLFRVDKFSGWDRVEGGGRANYGVQYTAQFNQGGSSTCCSASPTSCSGTTRSRSATPPIPASTAAWTPGAQTTWPRVSYQPNNTYTFTSRFRFDKDNFAVRRIGTRGPANFDRWSRQPALWQLCRPARPRLPDRRQGMLATASVKLDANWVLLGRRPLRSLLPAVRPDPLGVGYIDDCLILALNYITSYTYSGTRPPTTRSCCS